MQAFLLNPWNEKLLADTSPNPVRPVCSWKMFRFALLVIVGCLAVFSPASFILLAAFIDDKFTEQTITAICIVAGIGLFFILLAIPTIRREYRLLRYGRVLIGEVVNCKAETHTHTNQSSDGGGSTWTDTTVTIDYSFASPTGKTFVRTVKETHPEPPTSLPEAGGIIAVLYLDDDVYQVL